MEIKVAFLESIKYINFEDISCSFRRLYDERNISYIIGDCIITSERGKKRSF